MVCGVDEAGSVLGDATEGQRGLLGSGAATGAGGGQGVGRRGDLLLQSTRRRPGVLFPAGGNLRRRAATPLGVLEQSSAIRSHHPGRDL